jgi:DnaJ-class molecular chaperone
MEKDYYKILGIEQSASETEIKKAYRSLSYKYHPDQNPDPIAGERMREINEAYETLRDQDKKRQYDYSRQFSNVNPLENIFTEIFRNQQHQMPIFTQMMHPHHQPQNMPNMNNIHNIFEFMNHVGGHESPIFFTQQRFHPFQQPHQNQQNHQNNTSTENVERNDIDKPEPLEIQIEITFENAYYGQQLPIQIERTILNRKEKEKIYVNIPKGIDQDEIIIVPEKGNCVNQIYGDVKIQIKLLKHSLFERNGLNLIYNHTLTFKESICGFETIIENIDGNSLKLKSSPGNVIQNKDERVIKGKGFTRNTGTSNVEVTGDLIILFKVLSPKQLTERQVLLFTEEL